MPKTYRAAVIGSTGKGNYGHGLDTAFRNTENVTLVAVADDNPQGLAAAGRKLNVTRLYADYREMLSKERPDIVSIGPRFVTERVAMVTAAAAAGCHIYCEKPFAGDLVAADAMLAACDKATVKIAVAHQFRGQPPVRKALADLRAGKFGKLLRMWARPKDDHRGGGEELIVHGTHLFDLMVAAAGPPRWVSGHVAIGPRDAVKADAHEGNEPVGPIAGDSIAATFGFDGGVRGFFHSTANQFGPGKNLYGLALECESALLFIRSPGEVWTYPAPLVQPDDPKLAWDKVWIQDWHFTPDHKPRPLADWLDRGNETLVRELISAFEQNREPLASGRSAHFAVEMIQGVYASHLADGRRLPIPLNDRRHPLA